MALAELLFLEDVLEPLLVELVLWAAFELVELVLLEVVLVVVLVLFTRVLLTYVCELVDV